MYFKQFPIIKYPFNGKTIVLSDITQNIRILSNIINKIELYNTYIMKEGETPEGLAEKFYGDPNLEWVIMIANNRYNLIEDFPRTYTELQQYITTKYGTTADDIKFYVKDEFIVDSDTVGATPYTNREVEELNNESKRTIKIISNEYIQQIINEFHTLING